jgi:hypothetical protein
MFNQTLINKIPENEFLKIANDDTKSIVNNYQQVVGGLSWAFLAELCCFTCHGNK